MRTKTHQFQTVRVRCPVNQHKIGPDMAIPMIVPLADKGVIAIALWQGLVRRQG